MGKAVILLTPLNGTCEEVEVARETAEIWGYLGSRFFMLSWVSLA